MKGFLAHRNYHLEFLAGLCITLSAGMGGCTSLKVETNHSKKADFTKIRSYSWVPGEAKMSGVYPERVEIVAPTIKSAIEKELAAKGIKKITTGAPDILVAFHAAAYTKEIVDWEWEDESPQKKHYRKGTLFVDLIDPKSKIVLWWGIAELTKSGARPSEDDVIKLIQESIMEMFQKYPPR